jgi:transposase
MIYLTATTPILIATAPTDFRAGIDGFVARCQHQLGQDPRSGTLYVFINRARTMVRILVYEQNGYWLMTKRLSKNRYRGWPKGPGPISALQAQQLRQLLTNMVDSAHE